MGQKREIEGLYGLVSNTVLAWREKEKGGERSGERRREEKSDLNPGG